MMAARRAVKAVVDSVVTTAEWLVVLMAADSAASWVERSAVLWGCRTAVTTAAGWVEWKADCWVAWSGSCLAAVMADSKAVD